jgi:predicted flap endonuclease-1-like 5' DNA nuclease
VIWHFFEIWALVLGSFLVGSLLGALGYAGLSRSSFAHLQGALADRVGDAIDGIKTRFGTGPVWRPKVRRNRIRPSLQARLATVPTLPRLPPADARIERRRPAWTVDQALGRPENGDGAGAVARQPIELEDDASLVERIAANLADSLEFDEPDERPAIAPMRPVGIAAPRAGVPDDLQRIRGIGRRNEELLNSLGIFHFGQIAAWTPGEARWVGAYLAFPERIERDDWVGQATILASGGETGYVKAERRKARDENEGG